MRAFAPDEAPCGIVEIEMLAVTLAELRRRTRSGRKLGDDVSFRSGADVLRGATGRSVPRRDVEFRQPILPPMSAAHISTIETNG